MKEPFGFLAPPRIWRFPKANFILFSSLYLINNSFPAKISAITAIANSHPPPKESNTMKYSIIVYMALAILLAACEKNKTPLSVDDNNYTSHNYEWEIDTLHAPDALQIMMSGIWGTDENNVWVVGHSDETKYQVWHWDGEKWENHYLLFPGHPHSLDAIYGFSKNDIWAVGTDIQNFPNIIHRSFIIHYNGVHWRHIENIDAPLSLSVWGDNPANLFVGCDSGIVLHYDRNNWTKQTTGTLSRIYSIQGFNSNQVYAAGYALDQMPYDTTFYYFFEYDGISWKVLQAYIDYPFAPPGSFGYKLWASPDGDLYSVGDDGLYLWQNNSWFRLRERNFLTVNGTGWNNIFVGGYGNHLSHYNGKDWFLYNEISDNSIFVSNIWCNEKHVFVIGRPYFQSLIYRGTLKE